MTQPVYAIGDVHGQLSMLHTALEWIARDGGPDARIVFVGDYVDRGPHSREVIDMLVDARATGRDWHMVKGNHDRMFHRFLQNGETADPQIKSGKTWLHDRLGGAKTLASYADLSGLTHRGLRGVQALESFGEKALPDALCRDVLELMTQEVPQSHLDLLKDLKLYHEEPGFFFVHAGIRPGLPLKWQNEDDLLWIRDEFLTDTRAHFALVVHGHTPADAPDLRLNRLNLDTGAGYGRPLTAAVFDSEGIFVLTDKGRDRL